MKSILKHKYEDLISIDNLLLAWTEFVKGKRNKIDVQEFQFNLMDNILQLHRDLCQREIEMSYFQGFRNVIP